MPCDQVEFASETQFRNFCTNYSPIPSVFYPIFGVRIYGWIGDLIDFLSTIAAFVGCATALGFADIFLMTGINHITPSLSYLNGGAGYKTQNTDGRRPPPPPPSSHPDTPPPLSFPCTQRTGIPASTDEDSARLCHASEAKIKLGCAGRQLAPRSSRAARGRSGLTREGACARQR